MMQIRKAVESDLYDWAAMRAELWPDERHTHVSELLDFFAGNSMDIEECFVLQNPDNELCGFIELNIRNFAEGSRQAAVPYVEAWFIKAGFRSQGYGLQLMKEAEKWAQSQGYDELASDTEIENLRSIELHKLMGFLETERVVCFLKTLEKSGGSK